MKESMGNQLLYIVIAFLLVGLAGEMPQVKSIFENTWQAVVALFKVLEWAGVIGIVAFIIYRIFDYFANKDEI